jgi:hypothetical protein
LPEEYLQAKRARGLNRRVRRWRGGEMILRWMALPDGMPKVDSTGRGGVRACPILAPP